MHKMSDKIKDFLTNPNDKPNLVYEFSNQSVNGFNKINIYNKNIESPLQKIWLKLPKTKLLTNLLYGDSVTYKIDVAMAPITNEIKIIINYIEDLESKICAKIDKKYPLLEHKKSFKKKNDYMAIIALKLQRKHDVFPFTCYNHNNVKINPKEIESGMLVSTYIELSGVWISETEFGISWNVLQMKAYPVFNFDKCLFDDEDIEIPDAIAQNIPTNIPLKLSNNQNESNIRHTSNSISTNNNTSNAKPIMGFLPSVSLLQNMKNNLKKIN